MDEGKRLLDDVAAMGAPIVVLSGGDPLQRDDLEALVAHGKARGLRVGTIPAATERLTRERIASLARAGVDQLAFSIDASRPEAHDGFRQVCGSFAKTQPAERERAFAAGATCCLSKPFDPMTVGPQIRSLLSGEPAGPAGEKPS